MKRSLSDFLFPRFEYKHSMLWYHSRFSWTPEQQRALLVPGNDFHFLVPCGDDGFVKQRAVLQSTAAADAYFGRLLRPLTAAEV